MLKNNLLPFITFFFLLESTFNSSATTFTTISSGFWTNNNIWLNGTAPPLTTSDTIIIKNFIEFNSNIELLGPAFLRIDSSGALCGHDTIVSNAGTAVTTYGILECDVMLVPGGQILFYPPGYIIFTQHAHLSNGGSLHSTTAINVGPWFNCLAKTDIAEEDLPIFKLYPNPAADVLNISGYDFGEFFIYDLAGRILQNGIIRNNGVDVSTLTNGCYILILKNKESIFQKCFIKY